LRTRYTTHINIEANSSCWIVYTLSVPWGDVLGDSLFKENEDCDEQDDFGTHCFFESFLSNYIPWCCNRVGRQVVSCFYLVFTHFSVVCYFSALFYLFVEFCAFLTLYTLLEYSMEAVFIEKQWQVDWMLNWCIDINDGCIIKTPSLWVLATTAGTHHQKLFLCTQSSHHHWKWECCVPTNLSVDHKAIGMCFVTCDELLVIWQWSTGAKWRILGGEM
jgi:hypothetical protein